MRPDVGRLVRACEGRTPGGHAALDGGPAAPAHGTPSQINRFVFASTPEAEKRAELDAVEADALVAGHCDLPFAQMHSERLWLNAGAIGMPANNGRRETYCARLERRAQGVAVPS